MGVVSGIVKEAGTPVAGRIVRAYRRDTGALLGEAVSSDGITPPPPTYTPIAGENQQFTVTAGQTVRYGADTRWSQKTFETAGTYACGNSEFGDPASGTAKTRQLVVTASPLPVGEYSISTSHAGEVQLVCLDDDAGTTFNDLIVRTTPA